MFSELIATLWKISCRLKKKKKDYRRGERRRKRRQEESNWYEQFKAWTLKTLGSQDKFEWCCWTVSYPSESQACAADYRTAETGENKFLALNVASRRQLRTLSTVMVHTMERGATGGYRDSHGIWHSIWTCTHPESKARKENSKIKEERQLSLRYTCRHHKPTFSCVTSGALKLMLWRAQERHSCTTCRKSSVTGSSGGTEVGQGDPESRTLPFLVGEKDWLWD